MAAAALIIALAPAAEAEAAPSVRLVDGKSAGPPRASLVRGKKIRVRARGVRADFSARLGTRDVTARFRGNGRKRTAVLKRGRDFGRGSNRLVIGSSRGSKRRYAALQFVASKRERGSLKIRRVQRGGNRAALRIRGRSKGQRFTSIELKLNGRRIRTSDWVIGSRTPSTQWPLGKRRFRAMLGADSKLRYGVNRLVVTAWHPDGSFDRVARKVRISRAAPLASGGRGSTTTTGRRVRLDGRRTRARPRAGRLRYRWRIVDAPEGSDSELRRARSARPRLVPDVAGRYRIRLATKSRRSATGAGGRTPRVALDETTIEATPPTPPIGLPVETITKDGAIEVNGTSYPMPKGKTWAQMLVLDRRTLEVESNQGFGTEAAVSQDTVRKLGDAIAKLDATDMIILSGGLRGTEDWDIKFLFEEFQAAFEETFSAAGAGPQVGTWGQWAENRDKSLAQGRWSLIGVPNTKRSAYTNMFGMINGITAGGGSQPGALTGYLQLDAHNNYAFASPETTTIDTNAPGAPERANNIQIGTDVYTSAQLKPGGRGFHVLVLDSMLGPVRHETFTTSIGETYYPEAVKKMQEALAADAKSPGYLVIVQSIGDPFGVGRKAVDDGALSQHTYGGRYNAEVPRGPATWISAGGQSLAGAMGALGGPKAHDQIAQMVAPSLQPQPNPPSHQGYTLVASTGMLQTGAVGLVAVDTASTPVSRSQALSHTSEARVMGTLSRDHQSLWTLSSGTSEQGFNNGALTALMYQQPTAWPLSKTKAQRAANANIARRLGFDSSDVRVAYYEDSGQNWSDIGNQLANLSYPSKGSSSFNRATFKALKAQLSKEIDMVGEVQTLIDDWQKVFTSSTISGYIDLQSIAGEVLAEVERLDQQHSTTSHTEKIISDSLWIASGLLGPVPGVGEALGATAGMVALSSTLSEGPNGAPSVIPVTVEASELGQQVSARFEQVQASMGLVAQILVSDWGKLQQASRLSKGAWAFNNRVRNEIVDAFTRSAKREYYAALLSAVYGVYVVDPPWLMNNPAHKNPASISCEPHNGSTTRPLDSSKDHPASWMTRPVGFDFEKGIVTHLNWFGLYTQADIRDGQMYHNPDVLPDTISGPLFESLGTSENALGIDKLSFFADTRFERWWFWCTT